MSLKDPESLQVGMALERWGKRPRTQLGQQALRGSKKAQPVEIVPLSSLGFKKPKKVRLLYQMDLDNLR